MRNIINSEEMAGSGLSVSPVAARIERAFFFSLLLRACAWRAGGRVARNFSKLERTKIFVPIV